MGLAALATAVAVLPGLLTWAWGRGLVRAVDDPTLPERVLAWRSRSAAAFAAGAAILVVLLSHEAPWALPLLIFARLAGGFPARRALFGERWDFVAYLAHLARLMVSVAGFWLLLIFAPAIVAWGRPHAWPVAVGLALVLMAWGLAYPRVLLWLTGSTPLAQPELEARFAAIAEKSTAPMPRLWVAGHPEGRMVNALALPATGTPSVLFTHTLVEAFDGDELGAVFAHEQAHLEHFDARRVRRLAALQTLVVLLGTVGAAAAFARFEGARVAIVFGWPLVVVVAALLRLVRNRAHETESDRRAVELCGDAGALARALVKLHTLALLPRRLSVEFESRATHPSLANRLRAIEALGGVGGQTSSSDGTTPTETASAAGAAGDSLPTILQGARPGVWVLLDTQQAHWLEEVPEGTARDTEALRGAALRVRSLAYSELVELRLQPRGSGHELVASDRSGAAWSLPLASGEAASAQKALDTVDRRLAPPSAARPERKALGALVACAGAIVALVTLSAAVLPALVAIVLPHPGPLAAFGAAALAAMVLNLAAGGAAAPMFDPGLVPLANLGLAVFGVAALWIARTTAWRERAGRTRTAPWVASVLALFGLAFLALPVLGFVTGGLLRAHVAARDHPGGVILLMAAMAAFFVVPRPWGRVAAAVSGALSVAALILGTQAFAGRFVHDPFFATGTSTVVATVTPKLVDEQTLPAASGQLELSPSGDTWAIRQFEVGDDGAPPVHRMVVGSATGPQHAYQVNELVLVNDTRLLALFEDEDGAAVEMRPHDPAASAAWRVELGPLLGGAQLAAHPETGTWRVSGTHPESGAVVRATGERGGAFTVQSWEPGREGAAWVVGDGPAVLGVASRVDVEDELLETELDEESPTLWWLLTSSGVGLGSRVISLDAGGARELYESELFVQCDAPLPPETRPLCRANDGSRTALWRMEPTNGERHLVGVLEGFAWAAQARPDGWLLLVNEGTRQHLHLLEDNRLLRLDVGETPPWIQAVGGYSGGVGVLVSHGGRTLLRRYALP